MLGQRRNPKIDLGTLDYGPMRVVTGSMGYKHKPADLVAVTASLVAPNFLLKIIPHVDVHAPDLRACRVLSRRH
jgi:acetoacetate decarboxylase